jgi:hypothetical protein
VIEMVKNSVFKGLFIVFVVCLSLVFVMVILNVMFKDKSSETSFSEADFPLEIDLSSTVFHVGDKVSGTITITNRCGEDVTVVSNGAQPCAYLHRANETFDHVETKLYFSQTLKAGGKISRDFNWPVNEVGTFVLCVHYGIEVNGVWLSRELENIIIEVK